MKTATFPSLRVEPELRDAAESVLHEGESLSGFMEAALREAVERRRVRAEFFARGLASRQDGQQTGVYFDADAVANELADKLAAKRDQLKGAAAKARA